MRRSRASLTLIALALACSSGSTPAPPTSIAPTPPPASHVAAHAMPLPEGATIFVIVMENHSYSEVVHSPEAPYFSSLIARYGLATNYQGEHRHPSMPNYIELTSGGTWGIHDDRGPSVHPLSQDNLGAQLEAAGVPWRAYMESMGEPCRLHNGPLYAVKHDPFVYYDALREQPSLCQSRVVDFDAFPADLAAGAHRFMWITPNLCHDMHNCPEREGDDWLREHVPAILESPGFTRGGMLFITFDEGEHGIDRIATLVASPRIASPGFRSEVRHSHASLLATIEDQLGLPRLGDAIGAPAMNEFFSATSP